MPAKKKIAIVDDSKPFCLLVQQIFADLYEVDPYTTADEFIALTSRAAQYDLILLDLQMPGMDGLAALDRLQKQPQTSGIPILLLTADSRKDTVIRGKRLGASDYMIKPIDPALLEKRVAALLGEATDEAE